MIKKATCPNCGAEGTVGRYCEFAVQRLWKYKNTKKMLLQQRKLS